MNCKVIQRHLLECADPRQPDAEAQEHLGSCQPCQDWQDRLARLEHNVPRIPVPASSAKADFLAQLQQEQAAATLSDLAFVDTPVITSRPRSATPPRSNPRWEKTQAFLWKHRNYVSGGLAAAAVILLFVGWSAFMGNSHKPTRPGKGAESAKLTFRHDPLLAKLVQSNINLAQADTYGRRAAVLRRVANDLHGEAASVSKAKGGEALSRDLNAMNVRVNETLARIGHSARFEDDPGLEPTSPERLKELNRNHDIIKSLVNGALILASETDPLKRAESCGGLVALFAGELREPGGDKNRTIEMGYYLQDVLKQGVASNLSTVRAQGIDADKERRMRRIVNQVATLTRPIEERLSQQPDAELKKTYETIHSGRTEVENVLRI